MPVYLIVIFSLLGIIAAMLAAFIIYFMCSPMSVVRLIRRAGDGEYTNPPDYDEIMARVDIEKDLVYPSEFQKNNFDLYLPKAPGKHPLVLWVHGGSFVAGDKCGIENWGVMFSGNGYAAAMMNYEWAPEKPYPTQILQITQALKAIAEIAEKNGRIDMSRIAIAGDSAGAHMASQFALIHTNSEFSKRLGIKSPLKKDALKCALLYCGPFDLESLLNIENKKLKFFAGRIGWSYLGQKNWRKAALNDTLTPMNFVTKDYVPSYITDGNNFSFESHGKKLGEALRKVGVKVQERYFDKEQYGEINHGYEVQLETEPAMLCFNDTIEFLNENMQ